jgi:predicted ATPase
MAARRWHQSTSKRSLQKFEQGALARNGEVKLVRSMAEIKVPPTVQAVLASRIDRLPADEKELLQTLAIIGREFSHQLVQRVAGCPAAELERMLASLQSSEFIYEQPAFPDIEYAFKHVLTQEVAYNSVLSERRKLLHERAGVAIETINAGRLEDKFEDRLSLWAQQQYSKGLRLHASRRRAGNKTLAL